MFSLIAVALTAGSAIALSIPLGKWMFRVFAPPTRNRFEKALHLVIGRASYADQNWRQYSIALLVFNLVMFALVAAILGCQHRLPLNPDRVGPLSGDLLFNTATSFVTNTNLQHYSGETAMSYASQIFGLMWLQFVSAATGLAALASVGRRLGGSKLANNFYMDLARATFGVLLPLAAGVALLLLCCGVPMTFEGAAVAHTLEGKIQYLARGPVAAFVAIKQLGTNGGGFFGANSAHPFENPDFWSNGIECVAIMLLPMACVWLYGQLTGRKRHALMLFAVMLAFLLVKTGFAAVLESAPAPAFRDLAVSASANLEGKELRFGAAASPIWAAFTTASSNGSVNSMHSSLNPLTGLVPLAGMWFNTTFGGVGVGLLGMFAYLIVTVFIAGMMVGRTPEYLGKKIETQEMKLALPILLLHPLCILGGLALFCVIPAWGRDTVLNPGFHGFTEMLYEFTSAAANNGSGFEGLNDNTVPWNIATAVVMLVSRYLPIILALAIAGSLEAKKTTPETVGTLKTDTALFGGMLAGMVIFVGALLFLPVAVLGPVAEYLTTLR